MTELQYFRLLAPEFSTVVDATVEQWLSVARSVVAVTGLDGERAAMARSLYAAHMLRLTQTQASSSSAAVGPVLREKEGDLERTYGSLKGSDIWLGQTPYGQQYIEITRAVFGAGIMTRVNS